MTMQIHAGPDVPAGKIETAAGRILADSGHARLLAALDEAYEVTDHVVVSIVGDEPWQFFLGDHVGNHGEAHFGGKGEHVVLTDSSTPASQRNSGAIAWRGGHVIGNRHMQRFNYDGRAMTVEWTDERQQAEA